MTKKQWVAMRLRMLASRPVDTATPGDAYERWHDAYRATDRLDPEPLKRLYSLA